MNRSKRKLNDTFEQDSFKCRRSSLRVNLSCASNLSDSGNSSLRHIDTVDEETLMINKTVGNEIDKIHSVNSVRHINVRKNIPLKNVKVVLKNIQSTEQFLDTKCRQLKKAILNKTKEIFDQHNELSLKTELVLEANSSKTTNNSDKSNKLNHIDNSCKVIVSPSINTSLANKTMKSINGRSAIHNHISDVNSKNDQNKCGNKISSNTNVKEDRSSVVKNKRNTSAHYKTTQSFCTKEKQKDHSPILSASNKRLIKVKNCKRLFGESRTCNLKVPSDKCPSQSSISSISEDEDLQSPIFFSTALVNNETNRDNGMQPRLSSHTEDICNVNTKRSMVSMEMTDIRGGFIIDNTADHGNNVNEESMTARHVSLRVNTSIDAYETNDQTKEDDEASHAVGEISREEISEECSLKTTHTSLQINTSINMSSLERKDQRNRTNDQLVSIPATNKANTVDNECSVNMGNNDSNDTLENMSLIERLRNISIPNVNKKSKSLLKKDCTENGYQLELNSTVQTCQTQSLLSIRTNENNQNNDLNNSKRDCSMSKNKTQAKDVTPAIIPTDSSNEDQDFINSLDTVNLSDYRKNTQNKINNHLKVVVPKRTKKKLLPLSENSIMVSLTPNDEIMDIPESPRPRKNWRTKKKKQSNNLHINVNRSNVQTVMKNNYTQTQESSLDCDLEEFEDKKNKRQKSQKIDRKKENANKITNEMSQETSRETTNKKKKLSVLRKSSLNDFQSRKKGSGQSHVNKKLVLVATGLSREDKDLVKSIVKILGGARLEANVSKRTTHVISTGVRTINLLHGIIRGCWLVRIEWVLKSLENNSWLNPEEFEMIHFSKAVKENRKDRQLFGPAYIPELFATCGYIYVESGTMPPCNVLKDLIKAAGGRITDNVGTAKVVVGKKYIKESWVLDCITTGELQSCNEYKQR